MIGGHVRLAWVTAGLLAAGSLLGCGGGGGGQPEPETVIELAGEGFALAFDLERGRFAVQRADGETVLQRAFCAVGVHRDQDDTVAVYRSSDRYRRRGEKIEADDALGRAERALITMTEHPAGGPDLTLTLSTYAGRPFFTAAVEAHNPSDAPLRLARLVPAAVDAEQGGGLWLGGHPADHRILESGSYFLFDFFVDLVPGDVAESVETVALGLVHGYQPGHSISNWNHAIREVGTGRSFVAGSLDFDHASPMCNTSFDPELAEPADGRTPFTHWSIQLPYLPNGKPLPPDGRFSAGPVLVLPDSDDALRALETYAQAVHDHLGLALWPERGAEHRMPTGWNSWTGSSSSGGYGSGIDQALMIDNLDAMATHFRDFGGEWFQIDDGYEYHYGDWDWRPDRFPDGAAWLAEQIRDRGLLPGVWIAAFQVSRHSDLYAEHADDGWFPPTLPFVGGDSPVLDLTHPEVQAWLTERFRRIRADGYRWIKTDFCYWALGAAEFHDPTVTREEAYRMGLAAVQRGLDTGAAEAGGRPGDTFWLSVAMLGPHIGYADSIRPNLDTMPAWERESPDQDRKEAQGFKPTVRTIARRYYHHGRTTVFNHDMIFFRSHADPDVPRITTAESRCLLSAIGLSGSVAKLGEKLVEMEPTWINDYRRMLPVYGPSARPLDLFQREFPEAWHLRVVPEQGWNTAGEGPAYDVVGLFNWGANRDLTENPYRDMPDAARTVGVDLAAMGLDPQADWLAHEFWSGVLLETVGARLERELAPHTVELWAIRPRLDRPQLVGDNRHLLQGAVELRGSDWDPAAARLTVGYDAAAGSPDAPFTHRLDFHLPAGWNLAQAGVAGARPDSLSTERDGARLSVSFAVDQRRTVTVGLDFDRP